LVDLTVPIHQIAIGGLFWSLKSQKYSVVHACNKTRVSYQPDENAKLDKRILVWDTKRLWRTTLLTQLHVG